MKIALVVVIMLVGCTPRMHRAYQVTMASMGSVAWSCDAMQTNTALSQGMAIEANPLNGKHPGPARIWASTAASSALVWGVTALPTKHLNADDRQVAEFGKDIVVTAAVLGEAFVVVNNAKLMNTSAYRCGQ